MTRKTKPLRNIFTSNRLIDLVCSYAPNVSIHCGGIVDGWVRDCGGCVSEVLNVIFSNFSNIAEWLYCLTFSVRLKHFDVLPRIFFV